METVLGCGPGPGRNAVHAAAALFQKAACTGQGSRQGEAPKRADASSLPFFTPKTVSGTCQGAAG